MAKRIIRENNADKEAEIKRIVISIYADEFEIVKSSLNITDDLTPKNIREALGLKATHRKVYATELIKMIRKMGNEQKEMLFKDLKRIGVK